MSQTEEPKGFSAAKLRGSAAFNKRKTTIREATTEIRYEIEGKRYLKCEIIRIATAANSKLNSETVRKRIEAGKRTWAELQANPMRDTRTNGKLGARAFRNSIYGKSVKAKADARNAKKGYPNGKA